MKKSAQSSNEPTNSSPNVSTECSPWHEIKEYDSLRKDRKIVPKQNWEKGFQLVTSFLMLTLIGSKSVNGPMEKMAYDVAWTLPIDLLDHATNLAEAFGALYYAGGFAITQPGNQIVVSKSKREARAFLKSVKTARPATDAEIEYFLYEKTFNAKMPK